MFPFVSLSGVEGHCKQLTLQFNFAQCDKLEL